MASFCAIYALGFCNRNKNHHKNVYYAKHAKIKHCPTNICGHGLLRRDANGCRSFTLFLFVLLYVEHIIEHACRLCEWWMLLVDVTTTIWIWLGALAPLLQWLYIWNWWVKLKVKHRQWCGVADWWDDGRRLGAVKATL